MSMTERSVIHNDKSLLRKWFGPNRGTHWTIAGSVAVIMLGSYLVYSNRDATSVTAITISAPEQTPAPTTPAPSPPLASEKVK
jgi:hypothetical protein